MILGTPQLLRARTARDLQQIKANPDACRSRRATSPARIACWFACPRTVRATRRPLVSAQLLNRNGQPMSDVPVGPSAHPTPSRWSCALAALAPGEYILEIKAGDVKELVGFRVTP